MNTNTIRPATISDAEGIALIHISTWQCAYRGIVPDDFLDVMSLEAKTEGWRKQLSNPKEREYVYVAENDKNIVGWCVVGKSRDDDADAKTGELHGIYVAPEYMGRGVGTALMETAIDVLKHDGYSQATLWTLTANTKTRMWYEKKGWKVEGKTKAEERRGTILNQIRYFITVG